MKNSLVFLVVALLVYCKHVHSQSVFTWSPGRVWVMEGDDAVLSWRFDSSINLPDANIDVLKGTAEVINWSPGSSSSPTVDTTGDGLQYLVPERSARAFNFTLRGVTSSDHGTRFKCKVLYNGKLHENSDAVIVVDVLPRTPDIRTSPQLPVEEGAALTLTCSSRSQVPSYSTGLEYTWVAPPWYVHNDSMLYTEHARPSDNPVRCSVREKASKSSASAHTDIYVILTPTSSAGIETTSLAKTPTVITTLTAITTEESSSGEAGGQTGGEVSMSGLPLIPTVIVIVVMGCIIIALVSAMCCMYKKRRIHRQLTVTTDTTSLETPTPQAVITPATPNHTLVFPSPGAGTAEVRQQRLYPVLTAMRQLSVNSTQRTPATSFTSIPAGVLEEQEKQDTYSVIDDVTPTSRGPLPSPPSETRVMVNDLMYGNLSSAKNLAAMGGTTPSPVQELAPAGTRDGELVSASVDQPRVVWSLGADLGQSEGTALLPGHCLNQNEAGRARYLKARSPNAEGSPSGYVAITGAAENTRVKTAGMPAAAMETGNHYTTTTQAIRPATVPTHQRPHDYLQLH